jgi:hypothetical protein
MKKYTSGNIEVEWSNFSPAIVRYNTGTGGIIESQIDFTPLITTRGNKSRIRIDSMMKDVTNSLNRISSMIDMTYLSGVKNVIVNPRFYLNDDEYMGAYTSGGKKSGEMDLNYNRLFNTKYKDIAIDTTVLHELTHAIDISKYNNRKDIADSEKRSIAERNAYLAEMRYINKVILNTDRSQTDYLRELINMYNTASKSFVNYGGVFH